MLDIRRAGSFRKLTFHSKVVITTTAALLAVGTLLLKATEDMTWLGAFSTACLPAPPVSPPTPWGS